MDWNRTDRRSVSVTDGCRPQHSRNPKPEGESDLRSRRSHPNQRSPALNRFESACSAPCDGDTSGNRSEGLIMWTAVRFDATRARRSGVDHSLGMGEAPGSNPGESISFRSLRSLQSMDSPTCRSIRSRHSRRVLTVHVSTTRTQARQASDRRDYGQARRERAIVPTRGPEPSIGTDRMDRHPSLVFPSGAAS